MRFHNFWCISFVSSEFLKHVQKTPKSWEMVCSITIFHQNPEKHSYRLEKPSKLPFFVPPLFQTIMNKSLGTHRSSPSPHPTNNVGRVYPEFFLSFNFV